MAEAALPTRRRTPLEKAPDPDLGTEPIPKTRYTSPDFMQREWDGMWTRTWLMAGRESDVAQPGDYFTFEIGPESFLVVRQGDGSLHATYNVCLHRGLRLVEPGRGNAAQFRCGFHGWVYGRDGALRTVTDAAAFPTDLVGDGRCLRPLRCETWGGFVFVNMDGEAEPLLDYLGVIPEHLDAYHFESQSILQDVTLEIDCNWKTCVDAFNEAYHVQTTHPDMLGYSDDVDVQIDCYERHSRFIFKIGLVSPRLRDREQLTERMRELIMRSHGVNPDTFRGTAKDVRPSIVQSMRDEIGPSMGLDFSALADAQLIDDFHYTIFPNVTLNIHARGFWLFRHRPHESDPNKMYFDFQNLVWLPNAELPRPAHERHRADDYRFATMPGGYVLDQDMHNLPRIQAGMNSRSYENLLLGDQEIRIRHFHQTLMQYVGRG